MAQELYTIDDWLFTTLAADATLCNLIGGSTNPRIYIGAAEQGAGFPRVELRYISPVGGGDFETLNYERIWTRARYLIVAVNNKRSHASIQAIAARVDALIHKQSGSATNGTVHYCKREAPYKQNYATDGVYYTESGGFFEIAAKAS